MNFVADESVDGLIVSGLRQNGHDVFYIAESSPGLPDDDVLNEANARAAILLTSDKDFGEMMFRQRRVHAGVVLVRLHGLSLEAKTALVCDAVRIHGPEFLNAFSVILPGYVRVRHSTQ
jgi:predicted nuclease of predicted toxin-antitoxin system